MCYLDIPQEILFNIMLYGEIPQDLTNEYIVNAMRSINPNFRWVDLFTHVYHMNLNPIAINFKEVKKETTDRVSIHYEDKGDDVIVYYDVRRWSMRSYHTSDTERVTLRSIITSPYIEYMYERGCTLFSDHRRSNDIRSITLPDKYNHTIHDLHTHYPDIFQDVPDEVEILEAIRSIQPDFNMGYIFSRETFISDVRSGIQDDTGMNRIYWDTLMGRVNSMYLDSDILRIDMSSWATQAEMDSIRSIFPGCIVSLDLWAGQTATGRILIRALNGNSCTRLKICITTAVAAMMERH
jgi:hypothetical protein